MKQALNILTKLRSFLITLVVIGLFGYAAYQVSKIVAVAPDKDYLDKAKGDASAQVVKLDVKAVDQLKNLVPVDVKVDLSSIGKSDPFSP
ncbi:MAG TPA: hypothetical protein VLF41_02960 [Candidatus Nanoarchaeia archaeon]|nr:hypothetical protein [Candidatus Nanoarchaeia archaeon]